MDLKDFLRDDKNIVFDFTMDNECDSYKKIENPVDRYFAYRSSKKELIGCCYKEASDFAEKNTEKYNKVGDPDLSRCLLQKIYKSLWPDLCEKEFMLDGDWIQSDTMTSAQKTINISIERLVENDQEYRFRKGIGSRNRVSDAYCIELYLKDRQSFISRIKKIPGAETFLNLYHTLGNYVAVPKSFNAARSGNYASYDYWDLTLMKIREYFFENNVERIEELLHNSGSKENCKAWLDYFGVGEVGWKKFVDNLYFQDYVDSEYKVIPFCEGHSWQNPVINDCKEFFLNVSRLIYLRGKRMYIDCKKRCKE